MLLPILSFANSANRGIGHNVIMTEISANRVPAHIMSDLVETIKGNYTNRRKVINTHDFTGDGIEDKVICHIESNNDLGFEIINGVNDRLFYQWVDTPSQSNASVKKVHWDCAVAELEPGRAAVFTALGGAGPNGVRYNEQQVLHYVNNLGGISRHNMIRPNVNPFAGPTMVPLVAAARGITCTEYPQNFVKNWGYRNGALCFIAAYDSATENGTGTYTMLLKIEILNGQIYNTDLTQSSGLPWVGGYYGTSMYSSSLPPRWNSGSSNNLSMMAGAFVDIDRDGYMDLVTGGAHSEIFSFKMKPNTARSNGIEFTRTSLGYGYTHNLQALSAMDPLVDSTCVFFGEENLVNGKFSHLRCALSNGKWARYDFPGGKIKSNNSPMNIRLDEYDNIYLYVSRNSANPNNPTPEFYYIETGEMGRKLTSIVGPLL